MQCCFTRRQYSSCFLNITVDSNWLGQFGLIWFNWFSPLQVAQPPQTSLATRRTGSKPTAKTLVLAKVSSSNNSGKTSKLLSLSFSAWSVVALCRMLCMRAGSGAESSLLSYDGRMRFLVLQKRKMPWRYVAFCCSLFLFRFLSVFVSLSATLYVCLPVSVLLSISVPVSCLVLSFCMAVQYPLCCHNVCRYHFSCLFSLPCRHVTVCLLPLY